MFKYLQMGAFPPMHHTTHYADDRLLNEYCFTREGFEAPFSILYLHHAPTDEKESQPYKEADWGFLEKRDKTVLQRRHFKSMKTQPQGHFISGRTPLAFNEALTYGLCHPAKVDPAFFANNDGDELFFLAQGEIDVQTLFGKIKLESGDYLVIPRSCPYRFTFSSPPKLIYVEAKQNISIPDEFINVRGQLKMDAPYSARSFKCPEWDAELMEGDESVAIVRKRQGSFTHTLYAHNYFKMTGWDGYVYPYALNLNNIQPKTGRVHLPPAAHLTFAGGGFAVMSFLPRVLDFDEHAIPCPFYHSSRRLR